MPDTKKPGPNGGAGPFGLFGSVLKAGLHGPRPPVQIDGLADGKPPRPMQKHGTKPGQPARDTRRPQLPRRNGG
jgi:hypothetical protein